MAVRGSEILLIFRAKNQASATIRRVAKDVNFLGKTIQANQRGFGTLSAGRRASSLGAAMTHIGGAATLAGGGALFGLGTAARGFAEFDKLATQAATQIGAINNQSSDVIANAAKVRSAVLKEMQTFPDSAEVMSNAAYDIFSSMDVNFNKGIGLLHLFNQAGVAGMTDVETATSGAITVLNNFGQPNGPIGKSKKLLNDMFSIIRFGRIDLATLNTMMNQIAPAAAAADQSLEDVGGAIAVLTRRLGPGIASSGLARLFEIFQRKDFQEGMRKAGVAITDAQGQLLPLQEIVKRIVALGPKPGKTLQNFIQSITAFGAGKGKGVQATVQARRALVELIKHYRDYVSVQERVVGNQNQFNKQLKAMQQSLGVRWEVFLNNMRRVVLEIGEDAIPTFEDLGNKIGPVIQAWEGLDSNTKAWIITSAGAVASITLLGGLLSSFVGVLLGVGGAVTSLAGVVIGRLIPSMTAWASIMTQPGGPMYALKSLAGSLKLLAGGAAIAVGITLMHQGGEWNTLVGSILLGAGVGSAFGPAGAVVGAITVPIIMKIIQDSNKPGPTDFSKIGAETEKDLRQRAKDINKTLTTFNPANPTSADFFKNQRKELQGINKELGRRARLQLHQLPSGSLAEQAQLAAKNAIPRIGEDVARGITDNVKHIKNANNATHKALFSNVTDINKINKAVDTQLKAGNDDIKSLMQDRAQAMQQAADQQKQVLQQAVSNLSNTYDQLLQANQSAMGELFKGPFLSSETFDLANEWGITPAVKDLNKDLREQIAAFNKWHNDIRAIGRKGAPREMLQELEALGPDAVDKLEVLRKASPKLFRQFVRLWQQRQQAIKRETKIDFKDQLKEWNKYGHDIAFEIIAGIRGENVTLEQGFERYITQNFAGALNKIKTQALADFYKEHPDARKAMANERARQRRVRAAGERRKHELLTQSGDTFHIHQQPGETDAAFAKRIAWERDHRKGKSKKVVKPKAKPGSRAFSKPTSVRGGD